MQSLRGGGFGWLVALSRLSACQPAGLVAGTGAGFFRGRDRASVAVDGMVCHVVRRPARIPAGMALREVRAAEGEAPGAGLAFPLNK